MQCNVTYAAGMYYYLSKVISYIQILNFGYLSSGTSILTRAKM